MHSDLDIGTHFVVGQKVSHLTSFSSHSSYISFIFGFVTIRIYMTFTIILYSCSRLCTMHAQMYQVGENVTGSTEHPRALPGELLPCYAQGSRTDHSAFHSAN